MYRYDRTYLQQCCPVVGNWPESREEFPNCQTHWRTEARGTGRVPESLGWVSLAEGELCAWVGKIAGVFGIFSHNSSDQIT